LIVIVCKDCVDKTIPTTLIAVALVFILIVLLKEESINLLKKMSRNSKIHQYLNPNIEILIYLKLFLLLKKFTDLHTRRNSGKWIRTALKNCFTDL